MPSPRRRSWSGSDEESQQSRDDSVSPKHESVSRPKKRFHGGEENRESSPTHRDSSEEADTSSYAMKELKKITVTIERNKKDSKNSQRLITAITDPDLIKPVRRKDEGKRPIFDRPELLEAFKQRKETEENIKEDSVKESKKKRSSVHREEEHDEREKNLKKRTRSSSPPSRVISDLSRGGKSRDDFRSSRSKQKESRSRSRSGSKQKEDWRHRKERGHSPGRSRERSSDRKKYLRDHNSSRRSRSRSYGRESSYERELNRLKRIAREMKEKDDRVLFLRKLEKEKRERERERKAKEEREMSRSKERRVSKTNSSEEKKVVPSGGAGSVEKWRPPFPHARSEGPGPRMPPVYQPMPMGMPYGPYPPPHPMFRPPHPPPFRPPYPPPRGYYHY